MDVFGPNAYKSLSGNSFGLVIVDDFSRFTWVFFLDDKSQVQNVGNVVISKKIVCTRKIMVMHSNERGE